MPELPEVETNANNLRAWTRGRRVVRATPPPGTRELGGLSGAAFSALLAGRDVLGVERRGKWVLVELAGGAGLGLHFGMTGKLVRVVDPREAAPRFTRAELSLDDGARVAFVDARRFGKLLARERIEELRGMPELATLGPDALEAITPPALAAALARTRRPVKDALLDQRVLAGVGNLYATEALWLARIHPRTPARDVAARQEHVRALVEGVRRALREGLAVHARREVPFYIEEGGPNPSAIYGHAGEPCPRCAAPIEAIAIAGRTSAFCPRCQPTARSRTR